MKEKLGSVYLITNPNEKKFIVYTTTNIQDHIYMMFQESRISEFARSLLTHTLKAHTITLLEENIPKSQGAERKREWKTKHNIKQCEDKTLHPVYLVDEANQSYHTYHNGKWIKKFKTTTKRVIENPAEGTKIGKQNILIRFEENDKYAQISNKNSHLNRDKENEFKEQIEQLNDGYEQIDLYAVIPGLEE